MIIVYYINYFCTYNADPDEEESVESQNDAGRNLINIIQVGFIKERATFHGDAGNIILVINQS